MDKQKIVGKRWMSALLALILMMTLLPAPSAAADDSPNGENAIQNPSFEKPSISQTFKYILQQDVPAWKTTAKEGKIEFGRNWGSQTAPHYTSTDTNNAEGHQFAELNAAEESTLYQNVTTVGGNVYEWGLQHRGRIGVDKMALIIGPTQEKAPSKPSKNGRDQYMQLTDWVHDNQEKLEFTIPDDGCSQRLTVYSKPFGENGTFLGGSGSESPFSTEVSNIYTERWDVWIIATDNQHWVGYGIKDNAYQGDKGVGGGLRYECSYLVPDGQTQTTFAFCSYSSTPPAGSQISKTYGNLIDDLQFSLYHTVTISATPGSSKIMASTKINGNTQELDFSKNGGSIVVRNNNDLTLTVWENKNALNNGLETEFAGALVIGPNGSTFYSVGKPENMWEKVEKEDECGQKQYGFTLHVSDPVSIRLIFVQSPAVTYFANGGTYEPGNTSGVVSFKQTVDASGVVHQRPDYTSHAAKGQDGWRFDGWLSVRDKLLLPAIHTVSYNDNSESPAFTFKIDGEQDVTVYHGGVTLVAQWSYRQRAQVQLRGEDGKFTDSRKAGTVTIASAAETNDADVGSGSDECYAKTGAPVTATATAKEGYYFLGWAVEGSDEYVSTKPTYTYHVSGQETRTVYARFAKQYAVRYQWAGTLTGDKQPALPDDNIVLQGDSYAISTKYSTGEHPSTIQDTVNSVPGHWVFNGWKDQKDGVDLTGSIPNVNRDYVLVGYWTWVPNSEYQLSYFGGDNRTCWIPTEMSKVPDSSSHYQDSNVTVAGALTTTRDKVMLSGGLELEGTWSFTGWKRSDTGRIVPAGQSITMPGHNLELTAQWKFTPKTYTVKYDLADGTGRAPDGHTTFDYSRYTNGKTGVVEKNGIPFGADITLMDFTGTPPENTYFAGWSLTNTSGMTDDEKENVPTQGAGAVVNSTMMEVTDDNKEVTLYAVYRNTSKITVEFDVNAPNMGSVSVKSGMFTVAGNSVTGNDLTSVATAKPGYHFTGWTVEVGPENGDNASFEPLNNASLTIASTNFGAEDAGKRFVFKAQFAPNSFTVHFDADANGDHVTGRMDNQPFTFSAAHEEESLYLNPYQFHRPGYAFKGWSEYPAAERPQDSRTYPDRFKFAAVHTYQGNLIEHGDTVTLYAVWEALPNITIRYEAYGSGTVKLNQNSARPASGVAETGNPETGTFVGATAAPAKGWEFDGWYLNTTQVGNNLTYVPGKASGLYQAATYVASFVQKKYQVTFNANATDATGEMEPQTFTHGAGKALTVNAFVRPGYSFLGWATTKDGPVAYTNQQVVSIVENTTLYAVWCEDTVMLFYDADAAMGTVSRESETVNAVTTETASGATAAAKDGYRFIGWYSETGDKLSDNASFAPQKPNGAQPEDNIWKTAHYIARFERVGDPKPIDPVKPGGDDSKDSYYFAIEKIDAQDSHALNGATFALYQYSSDGKTVNRTTAKTARNGSESGIALFSVDNKNSYEGIWYYAEVTAPEGYVLDSTEHKITKNDFSTSQSAAIRNAETVRNYRSSTPNMLNDTDHFAYVIGYKDGLVKPYGLITRAETTTIFFRLLKDSVRDSSLLTSSTYTDVPDNYWANTAISTMTGLGIVQGRSTTTFDPQSPITRAQFAAICARFDTGTSSGTQIFSDISGHWAEKYIQRAAELGWIKGFEDGTFRPDTYITRAQAMTMINRVLNRIPEEESDLLTGMNVWPDCNPGDWFYLAVQEATNSHAFKHKAGNYETWIGMSQNPDWTRYEN